MITIRKIENENELKMDQTILTVDLEGNEHLEKVTCIDNGEIFTKGLHDEYESNGESLDDYLDNYDAVYEVTAEKT